MRISVTIATWLTSHEIVCERSLFQSAAAQRTSSSSFLTPTAMSGARLLNVPFGSIPLGSAFSHFFAVYLKLAAVASFRNLNRGITPDCCFPSALNHHFRPFDSRRKTSSRYVFNFTKFCKSKAWSNRLAERRPNNVIIKIISTNKNSNYLTDNKLVRDRCQWKSNRGKNNNVLQRALVYLLIENTHCVHVLPLRLPL